MTMKQSILRENSVLKTWYVTMEMKNVARFQRYEFLASLL